MTWGRAALATALALTVGLLIGIGAERVLRDDPVLVSAEPLEAESPSVPAMTVLRTLPDPDLPALATDLTYRTADVGAEPFLITLEVPADWEETALEVAEKKWVPPGRPEDTYFIRVEKVASQRESVSNILTARIDALGSAPGVLDLQILERTSSTLTVSYLNTRQHRRFQTIRWVSPANSGMAEVELVVNGRERDLPGMSVLLDQMTTTLRS